MATPALPAQFQATLDCLRQVNRDTLERKRRLGHYAVIWRDGEVLEIGDDAPAKLDEDATLESSAFSEKQQLDPIPE